LPPGPHVSVSLLPRRRCHTLPADVMPQLASLLPLPANAPERHTHQASQRQAT
jgi:hypothetical protein